MPRVGRTLSLMPIKIEVKADPNMNLRKYIQI